MEAFDDAGVGEREPAQVEAEHVHREEARAADPAHEDEAGERARERRDGVQAGRREARSLECHPREPAERDPAEQAEHRLLGQQQQPVREAEVGLRDDVDEQDHQDRGDRVVEPALALEDRRQPAGHRGGAQRAEDRGRVGRRDDRADQEALAQRQVEQQRRRDAADRAGDHHPDAGQHHRRLHHPPDGLDVGGEPALEQDDRQADERDLLGQVGVVEVHAAGPVLPDQDPHAQEQQQRRGAEPVGEARCRDPGEQDGGADQEDVRWTQGSGQYPGTRSRAAASAPGPPRRPRARAAAAARSGGSRHRSAVGAELPVTVRPGASDRRGGTWSRPAGARPHRAGRRAPRRRPDRCGCRRR